jgi:hypothetical protein
MLSAAASQKNTFSSSVAWTTMLLVSGGAPGTIGLCTSSLTTRYRPGSARSPGLPSLPVQPYLSFPFFPSSPVRLRGPPGALFSYGMSVLPEGVRGGGETRGWRSNVGGERWPSDGDDGKNKKEKKGALFFFAQRSMQTVLSRARSLFFLRSSGTLGDARPRSISSMRPFRVRQWVRTARAVPMEV